MSTIAVIGAGTIGGILARKLGALGHQVRIANSKAPTTLASFDAEGVTPAWAADALTGAEVAILSLPQAAITALSPELRSALQATPIVVETGNYYPDRDGRIAGIDDGLTDSQWVEHQLGRPVIKAFNSIGAMSLLTKGVPAGTPRRVGLAVAGAAGPAKQTVMALVDELGFDPVDGGDLADSWRQQPGTPGYCADLTATEIRLEFDSASAANIPAHQLKRDKQDSVGGSAKQRTLIAHGKLLDD